MFRIWWQKKNLGSQMSINHWRYVLTNRYYSVCINSPSYPHNQTAYMKAIGASIFHDLYNRSTVILEWKIEIVWFLFPNQGHNLLYGNYWRADNFYRTCLEVFFQILWKCSFREIMKSLVYLFKRHL